MPNLPQGFETPVQLTAADLPPTERGDLKILANRGFMVVAGLAQVDVPAIAEIASQESVREYCPKDLTARWADEEMTKKQLAKDGGRGVLRVVNEDNGETAAFGWVGSSGKDEREFLPMCENTFAVRVSERYQRRGLATPTSRLIVAGSMALWHVRGVGLETWGSNAGAVKAYVGAGALLVATQDAKRPTRIEKQQDDNGERFDVRQYMYFPQSMHRL